MTRTSLLLHSCCAPCTTYVYDLLEKKYDVVVFFYNPNIQPEEEYRRREEEIRRFASEKCFELIVGPYDEPGWMDAVKGFENEPEGGARCRLCFRYRLEKAAAEAARLYGIKLFTSTLSVSPHKNAKVINEEGVRAAEKYEVEYLESDFKKRDGFKKSVELSKKHGFFRQNYCGCEFSKKR